MSDWIVSMAELSESTDDGMRQPEAARKLPPWRGWEAVLVFPAVVLLFTPTEWPRWLFMWSLAAAIFIGCKWLTWRRTPGRGVPWWRHAAYLLAWPGLDAQAFLRTNRLPPDQRPRLIEWASGAIKLLFGAIIFWGVRLALQWVFDVKEHLTTWWLKLGTTR